MKNRNNGSRIFMTELMFSILFFIIVSAICVQCFATAYAKSKDAKELTQAVNIATNAAEEYLGSDSFGDFTDYYDDNWKPVDDKGSYKATGVITEANVSGGCQSLQVVVSNAEDEEIYSLKVEKAVK
ncbi:hypothetical protein SAMN02910298_01374 [Pseudobutyrivibrio sp. YE44]|uniref:hypothetical protein n=1 Tax=Pseudobutyrivibrio sp. YE44 TaxID=1520802 RepID=UPI00088D5F63|nr:hypothetical protein [Pseudobutyrivibrio sp. YE44]SDB28403.1 hypothetical protein SAMN02910298_01374 [Pseudobutyrivibrio sp. YE44]